MFLLLDCSILYTASPSSPKFSASRSTQAPEISGSYDELAPPQRRLVDDWFRQHNEIMDKKLVARDAYEKLPISVRTTFEAVTHALMLTALTDDQGQTLGTAVELVDDLETVLGQVPGAGGDHQFRIVVLLRPDAVSVLDRSQQFSRHHDNTHFHQDYPRNYRQRGVPSIQFSISEHGVRADIDVDYRSAFFLFVLFDGHLTAANSDVRAGNNYQRHVDRWSAFTNWWGNLFGLGSLKAPDDASGSVFEELLPSVPRVDGSYPLPVVVEDFFSSWLVQRTPEKSMAYLAEAAYNCIAEFEPGTESWKMAPVESFGTWWTQARRWVS